MSERSVVIVGGGVIGLCVGYYAMRRGWRVTILERGAADHDGCSAGNAGMIVPSHFTPLAAPGMVAMGLRMMWNPKSPFYIRPRLSWDLLAWAARFASSANARHVARAAPVLRDLSLASRACFEEIAEATGDAFGLVKRGLLMLCESEATLRHEAATAAEARALGVPAEVLSREETAQRDPAIQMNVAGAVYFPLDCHLAPHRFLAALTEELKRGGATFAWSSEVTGWRLDGTRIAAAVTRCGEQEADEFVIAGGAWSPEIVRGLRVRLPMEAGKGYSLTLPAPRRLPGVCSILTEARVAVTPMGAALRVGGTMELAGLDESINRARVRGIVEAVPRYFPELRAEDFDGLPVWRGLRPCSPDGLPYVGRCASYANLSAATGHAMMGLSLGPVTGKLISEILCGDVLSAPIASLAPDRF